LLNVRTEISSIAFLYGDILFGGKYYQSTSQAIGLYALHFRAIKSTGRVIYARQIAIKNINAEFSVPKIVVLSNNDIWSQISRLGYFFLVNIDEQLNLLKVIAIGSQNLHKITDVWDFEFIDHKTFLI
jgi:hypothetical protein